MICTMNLRMVIVFIALFQFSGSFPVAGITIQLPAGHTYTYDYVTTVTFNEPDFSSGSQAKNDVGFTLTCKVSLEPVFIKDEKMLIKVTIKSPKLVGMARKEHKSQAVTLSKYPVLVHLDGTLVRQVYTAEKDPVWSTNIKKGVLTLLQIQKLAGTKTEVDASGECKVTYKVDGLKITKTKRDCNNINAKHQFSNIHDLLGIQVTSNAQAQYTLSSDSVIQSVTSQEQHSSRVTMRDSLGALVISKQTLTLEKKSLGAEAIQASTAEEAAQVFNMRSKLKLQGTTLATSIEHQHCDVNNCDKITVMVKNLRPSLIAGEIATVDAAKDFLALVTALRYANKEAIRAILTDKDNKQILPQLVEAITAAQTTSGQAAVMSILNFDEQYDVKLHECYLLATAFSTHPPEALLRDLYDLYKRNVKSQTLRESIGDALGAVMYSYCQIGSQCTDKVVEDAVKLILERVEACSDATCRLQELRILGNAGIAKTMPVLLKYSKHGQEAVVMSAAIKAMRRMLPELFDEKVKTVMRNIYHQYWHPYDSAVRTQALMILLTHNPSDTDIHEVIDSTTDPDQTEHSQYVQQRLFQMAERDSTLRAQLKKALHNVTMSNYHVLAPKGKGLAFKENIADMGGLAITYDMYVQNSKAGIMKRSGMDVDLVSSTGTMSLYSVGIFAAGLESLVGEEVEKGQENVESTAGLALNLLDVALRPVTFFTGQSGLMSAVWNAPSELTNALQINLMLQDHSQAVPLQNGFTVDITVQGAVSIDLSGLVSISLWNRNCNSLIKNSAAFVIQGTMSILSGAVKTSTSFTAQSESILDFITDVDFYDKIKMCLQMSRPALKYQHHVIKYEKINGFKTAYRANIRRTTRIPGGSYPLPKMNYEQCRMLLAGQ